MRANMNMRMGMTPKMKTELLRDLAGLLPREERKERKRRKSGRPISCSCTCGPPLVRECGTCEHFLFTHHSNRSGNTWGRCRRFGTPVGRYGEACEEFSPSNYAGDRRGYR